MVSLEALRTACREGDNACIRRYLALKGPDLLAQDQSFYAANSCLWLCAEAGHSEALGALVRAGWSVSGEQAASSDGTTSQGSVSPLYVAAQNGHADAVRVLLEYGADVEVARASSGATALYVASQHGQLEVLRVLLREGGADVEHGTRDGLTPLMVAAHQGHVACVTALRRAGADPQRRARGQTAQQWAVTGGHGDEWELAQQRAALPGRALAPARRAVHVNPTPRLTPSVLAGKADALEEAIRADAALHETRTRHLHGELEKHQRGDTSIFTVRTVQEVEQIQAAWETYKRRLESQAKARASADRRSLTSGA